MLSREALAGWWGGPLPERDDWAARYPARQVSLHARSRQLQARIEDGARAIAAALEAAPAWQASVSCGKDSTALALLLSEAMGSPLSLPLLSVRDDLCWPGEELYLSRLADRVGARLELPVAPLDLGRSLGGGTDDKRKKSLSGPWFEAADASRGARSLFWGLRADESVLRRRLLWGRGDLYQISDGSWRSAPLMKWSALDVHAMLWRHDVPPHPVYGCIDPEADPMKQRHSWFVVGLDTYMAEQHFVWLRRWWPAQFDRARTLWPEVASIA